MKDIFRPFVYKDISFEKINKNIIGYNKNRYFDYTASGLGYKPIEKRMQEILETYANTHSEFASNAKITSYYYNMARKNLKYFLGIGDCFALIPCGTGATGAIKRFQEIIGIYLPPATKTRFGRKLQDFVKPLVVVGAFEHHSNEISYKEALCDVIRIPLDDTGNIDLNYLEEILKNNKNREIIGAFSIASNVTGIILPYKKISTLLKQYNAIVAFDCAASSPCIDIDSKLFDAIFLSPHKLLGGPGTCGLLAIKKSLINNNEAPTFAGGGTVTYVSKSEYFFNKDIEIREDAGTPAILQLIKASFVYQLRNEIGIKRIKQRKIQLFKILMEGLSQLKSCIIYGQNNEYDSVGILSLNFKGINPFNMCRKLSENFGIQTRAGCSCAGPYGQDLLNFSEYIDGKPSWLRISVNYTHSEEDVKYLLFALKQSQKELSR